MEKGILPETLVVISFFLSVAGCLLAGAFWLSKKGWAGFGGSLGLLALTGVIGFGVGFFLIFLAVISSLPVIFDNTTNYAPPSNGWIAFLIVIFSVAFLSIPFLLTIGTRLSLAFLKVESSKPVWQYSIISSLLTCVCSLAIPVLLGYLFYRFPGKP